MSLGDTLLRPVDAPSLRRIGLHLASMVTPRSARIVAVAVFGLIIFATVFAAIKKPEYNWDMAPYIAVSLEDRITDPVVLHRESWEGIRQWAPAGQWYELTAGNLYNADLWENPDHFVSQLTMYRVKIGYIEAVRFLDRFMTPVMSTVMISALSGLAVGLIVLFWAVRRNFVEGLLFLAPVLILAGYFNMALLATPDLFMAVFGLVAIYLVVHERPWASVPFLIAMFLVRPDGIIFIFALLLASLAFGYARLPMLAAFLAGLVLYGPIAAGANHPGWWPHFYFSILELQNDMRGFAPAFSVVDYLRGIVRGISVSLRWNNWPMIMGVLLMAWAMLASLGRGPGRHGTMMLTAIVLAFGGKFLTFPLPDDRVYFMFVAGFAIILFEAWKPTVSTISRRPAAAAA